MELMVVMAILGILATIVVVAVNPAEQLAKGRDTSRITSISQLGRSIESFNSSTNGLFPTSGTNWMDELIDKGDLRGDPVNPDYISATSCNDVANFGQGGFCYKTSDTETIIYAQLESKSSNNNCLTTPNTRAYFVYSYTNARSCGYCGQEQVDPDVNAPIVCNF